MKRTIHLHGKLGQRFGKSYTFDVDTAGESLRALHCAFPEFVNELREGYYEIIRGDIDTGMGIDVEHINDFKLGNADLHIVPVAEGSKSGRGTIKAIAGIVLIGAAVFLSGGTLLAPLSGMTSIIPGTAILGAAGISYGTVAVIGLGLVLSGVASTMSKTQAAENGVDKAASFTFSGPVNVNAQGYAIPLIYGEVITGSQSISSGFDIENIGAYSG